MRLISGLALQTDFEEDSMRVRVAKVLMVLFLFAFAAGFAFAGGTGEKASAGPKYKFTMVIYGTVGNPFWKKVVAGAKDAATGLGADLDIQYADDDSVKQVSILETAIVNKVDGIAIIINLDDA
jgi:ABC-type sugar transport system substrate-binding protein